MTPPNGEGVAADALVPFVDDAASLFDRAPCGYLTAQPDGTIVRANETILRWIGRERDAVIGTLFQELFTRGGQIFYETHLSPLLRLQGAVEEVALDLRTNDDARFPVLVNATLELDTSGVARLIRAAIFDARQRRAYERELVRMRDDEHHIAQVLQDNLLASDLPASPRLEIAAHYAPAIEGLSVGGDWYDAFMLTPGRVALVVGDIMGKGLAAAAAMGHLRSAVRAYAAVGQRPGALLGQLDAFVAIEKATRFATVIYVQFDLDSGSAVMASAGHPPALLARPDGTTTLVWEGRSAPLGAYHTPFERTETTVHLDPGTRLLLYTDGLIERRNEPLDLGFSNLADATVGTRGTTLAAQVADIVATLRLKGANFDDVCLLATRTPDA